MSRIVVGRAAVDIVASVTHLEMPHDVQHVLAGTVHVLLDGFGGMTKRIQGQDGEHGRNCVAK